MFQKGVYRLFHKKSIFRPYINLLRLDIKKEAKIWDTLKNIEVEERLVQKKEEQEKETKKNKKNKWNI